MQSPMVLVDDEIFDKIMSGKAILFTGAGFSQGATNIDGDNPPLAKDLSRMIARLGDFPEDDDLMFTSDYYIENCDVDKLVSLLRSQYTMREIKDHHRIFCNANWRRIYTTNYDNVITKGFYDNGKYINDITLDDSPSDYFKRNDVCVHINGSISSLDADSLKSSFKLSASSYISPDSFKSSQWFYSFKKDIEKCSAIIFAGYSLYDMDIQKILYELPELKEKTYFITIENPSTKEEFTFSKFGKVVSTGVEKFARLLKDRIASHVRENEEFYTEAFVSYKLEEPEKDISDNEISRFFLHGELDEGYIANAAAGVQRKPYIINRSNIGKVLSLLSSYQHIVICSELGNGKTIFSKQLMATCQLNDRTIYYLVDEEADYYSDIDKLGTSKSSALILIEGYDRYRDLIKYIATCNYKNLKYIFSSRTSNHDRMRSFLRANNLDPYELNIDILNSDEKAQFVEIINNLGYWGEEARFSKERKLAILTQEGQSQVSHTLLHLFNSPQIKDRIGALIKGLAKDENIKKTIFAICLIEALDLPLRWSLISEVSGVDTIYKVSLRHDPDFVQLFGFKGDRILSKSPLFSLHVLKYHFSPSFAVDTLLGIVTKFYAERNAGQDQFDIYKSLLRFSFIEKILPVNNKDGSLIKYYDELKVHITWMKKDPHYWLQYAMAKMMLKDYPVAEKYLQQAYSFAGSIDGYNTSYLDIQQARLLLLKSFEELEPNNIFRLFKEAHILLTKQEDDVYKYRQVILYRDFYNSVYSRLPVKFKVQFEHACKNMQKSLSSIYNKEMIITHDSKTLRGCSEALQSIIEQIASGRS